MDKKKYLVLMIGIILLCSFSCCYANDENKPNTSLEDTWLSADSMLKILESLKVETANSGELCFLEYYTGFPKVIVDGEYPYIWTYTANKFSTAFNNWFHTYYYNYDVVIGDLVFYWSVYTNTASSFAANNSITIFVNGTPSVYVGNYIPNGEFYSYDVSYTGGYKTFYRFSSFRYDSNNNKTGINNQEPNNNCFVLTENSCTVNNYGNTPNVYVRYLIDSFYVNNDSSIYSTTMGYLTFNNENQYDKQIAYKYYYRIPTSSSNQISYNMGYLNRKIDLGSGETPTPTPTTSASPVPSSTGFPGGGTDLSNIENGINNIENALTTTPSGDDFVSISSGDMLSALDLPAIDDPSANFWLAITDGLTTALTCPNNTSIQIPLIGATFTANSSDFELPDNDLKTLIRMACVVGFVLVEYKLIRKIIAYFSSGVFKQIFNAYSRMDISDLF